MSIHPPLPAPSPRQFRWFGLHQQFATILIVLVVMAAGNVVTVQSMLTRLDGVAETVNIAGRLRMLSQKIAFEQLSSWHHSGANADIETTLDAYERGLVALEQGGQSLGLIIPNLPAQIRPLVMTLRTDWTAYRDQVRRLYGKRGVFADQLAALTIDATRLLGDAELLVAALTMDAKRAKNRMKGQLALLLLAELLIFAGLVLLVRQRILRPLGELTQYHRALASGH